MARTVAEVITKLRMFKERDERELETELAKGYRSGARICGIYHGKVTAYKTAIALLEDVGALDDSRVCLRCSRFVDPCTERGASGG